MNTPLIVGIIVGTVLFPIYLTVGMIWLNKVKKFKKEKQPIMVGNLTQTHFLIQRALYKTDLLLESQESGKNLIAKPYAYLAEIRHILKDADDEAESLRTQ